MKRRVVVTGLGVVSPLGLNVRTSWKKLISGECGISQLNEDSYLRLPCRIAGLISKGSKEDDLDFANYFSKHEIRVKTPVILMALIAADEALKDAKWVGDAEKERTGVSIGTAMTDVNKICKEYENLKDGYNRVSPHFVPQILPNMAAGEVSIKYGFQGPNHAVSTACATGLHAVGDGFKFIQNCYADVMVCGCVESCINPLSLAGFCRLRALATNFNDAPHKASMPFDKSSDGFVMGEGGAMLVLEEMNHALARGAHIYAEILGYGLSGDGTHVTSPHKEGKGAVLSMKSAIHDAGIKLSDVSYISAHATSTPIGDSVELKAIKSIFHEYTKNIAISSTKGAHGHLLGAAGSLESVFTVIACHEGIIPPTINLNEPCSEGEDLNLVQKGYQIWNNERKIALKNSFGFGGTNATLCISEFIR